MVKVNILLICECKYFCIAHESKKKKKKKNYRKSTRFLSALKCMASAILWIMMIDYNAENEGWDEWKTMHHVHININAHPNTALQKKKYAILIVMRFDVLNMQ